MIIRQHTPGTTTDTKFNTAGGIDYQRLSLRGRTLRSQAMHSAAKAILGYIDRRVIRPLRRWREINARYHELMALDERILKDIGISRSDISAIAGGVWGCAPQGSGAVSGPRIRCVVDNGTRQETATRCEERTHPLAA